jgi:hypothetical protein
VLVKVFLRDEVPATARRADDTHPTAHDVYLWLVLEAARPDVYVIAELAEFFREFENVNDLTPGVCRTPTAMAETLSRACRLRSRPLGAAAPFRMA